MIKNNLLFTLNKLGLYDKYFILIEDLEVIMRTVAFDNKHLKLWKDIGRKNE